MDHLPPHPVNYNPITVPLLCSPDLSFELQDFASYGDDIPLDSLSTLQKPLSETSAALVEKWAPRMQAWLYFSFLSAALQLPVAVSDFASTLDCHSGTVCRMASKKLLTYLHRWRDEHREATHDPLLLEQRRRQSIAAITGASEAYRRLQEPESIFQSPEVHVSLISMVRMVAHAMNSMSLQPDGTDIGKWIGWRDIAWKTGQFEKHGHFSERRLIDQGWCPSIVKQFARESTSDMCAYYLSLFGPPRIRRHQGCEENKSCKSLNISRTEYKPAHADLCSGCKFLKPDMVALITIVEQGRIPVLHLTQDGQEARLLVEEYSERLAFTAISHVWADGTGNKEDNSLPECQIRKIVGLTSKIPWTRLEDFHGGFDDFKQPIHDLPLSENQLNAMPRYFWIDTICVPLAPQTVKLQAIQHMAQVYKSAYQVLVLDRDLMDTPLLSPQGFDPKRTDGQVRILGSNWRWRAWTLQEALCAKRLWFQFRGELFQNKGLRPLQLYFDDPVTLRCNNLFLDVGIVMSQMSFITQVCMVWSGLCGRGISFTEDTPVIVAILLDLDVEQLQDTPPSDRHRKLWSMYRQLHLLTICGSVARRPEAELRWAPLHFQDLGGLADPRTLHPMVVHPNGQLNLISTGFILPITKIQGQHLPIKAGNEIWYLRNVWEESWELLTRWVQTCRIGVVINAERGHAEVGKHVEGNFWPEGTSVALLKIIEKTPSVVLTEYLGSAWIFRENGRADVLPTNIRPDYLAERNGTPMDVEVQPAGQEWQILPASE